MNQFFEMLAGAGAWGWIILFVALSVIGLVVLRIIASGKLQNKSTSQSGATSKGSDANQDTNKELDAGGVKCMCFRNIKGVNVVDFTIIPEPTGEMYQFDPSLPFSGMGYIVKEVNKEIKDYDPREVVYEVNQSPEIAWFAINWSIVKEVFFVPLQWWKSPSVWFAGIMLGIIFIVSLAVIGG